MDVSGIEEELLTCELCEELAFTEERDLHMLPCQHNLCTVCLRELIKKKIPRVALTCPWCRKKFAVGKEANLPKHRYARKLSELIKKVQDYEHVKIQAEKLDEELNSYPKFVQWFQWQKHRSGIEVGKVVIEANRICMVFPDVPGIIYHDIVGNSRAQKMGISEAMYGDICLIDDELYAYNMTEGLIEVYNNLTLFHHWKLTLPSPFFEQQNNIFGFLSVKLVTAPMGLLVMVATENHQSCWLYTKSGKMIEINRPMRRNDLETLKHLLSTNTDISVHGCSLWIYSKEKDYLFQVPMKPLNSTKVKIGAPIRHCRISGYKCSHGIDEGKLLYCTNGEPDIVKVIDLDSLTKAFDILDKREQKRAYKDAAIGRNYLRTVGVGEVTKISVDSSATYIALIESKALVLYQMKSVKTPTIPASNDQRILTHLTTGQSSQTEERITHNTEDHHGPTHFAQTDEMQVSTKELSWILTKRLAAALYFVIIFLFMKSKSKSTGIYKSLSKYVYAKVWSRSL